MKSEIPTFLVWPFRVSWRSVLLSSTLFSCNSIASCSWAEFIASVSGEGSSRGPLSLKWERRQLISFLFWLQLWSATALTRSWKQGECGWLSQERSQNMLIRGIPWKNKWSQLAEKGKAGKYRFVQPWELRLSAVQYSVFQFAYLPVPALNKWLNLQQCCHCWDDFERTGVLSLLESAKTIKCYYCYPCNQTDVVLKTE